MIPLWCPVKAGASYPGNPSDISFCTAWTSRKTGPAEADFGTVRMEIQSR